MSCNGCRVLGKVCTPTCTLKTCLPWILSPAAQRHAALFLAGYYGYNELMSRISAVPEDQRGVMFQSLLFEACGRAVNPVTGVAGLQVSGNWHVVQAVLNSVMVGRPPRPIMQQIPPPVHARVRPPPPAVFMVHNLATLANHPFLVRQAQARPLPPPNPATSGITEVGSSGETEQSSVGVKKRRRESSEEPETTSRRIRKPKLLNLFV